MGSDPQGKAWHLVVNNPQSINVLRNEIVEKLKQLPLDYFCLADEIGKGGTFHTHAYLHARSALRFSTIKNKLPTAHIERARGSAESNREYIRKGGKWEGTDKAETSIPGSFEEWGTISSFKKTIKTCKQELLLQMIADGYSTMDIINKEPSFAYRIKDIDLLRQTFLAEKNMNKRRCVNVTYIYGASGSGKTRGVYDRHEAKDICRITTYRQGKGVYFDAYSGQKILVFEEFRSQIPISDMLNYLDVYPINLPARYADRTACYDTVYILSNIALEQQYVDVQINQPETWKALLRRINNVVHFDENGSITVLKGSFNVSEAK